MPRNHVVHGTFGSVTKLRRLGGGGGGEGGKGGCMPFSVLCKNSGWGEG